MLNMYSVMPALHAGYILVLKEERWRHHHLTNINQFMKDELRRITTHEKAVLPDTDST